MFWKLFLIDMILQDDDDYDLTIFFQVKSKLKNNSHQFVFESLFNCDFTNKPAFVIQYMHIIVKRILQLNKYKYN